MPALSELSISCEKLYDYLSYLAKLKSDMGERFDDLLNSNCIPQWFNELFNCNSEVVKSFIPS